VFQLLPLLVHPGERDPRFDMGPEEFLQPLPLGDGLRPGGPVDELPHLRQGVVDAALGLVPLGHVGLQGVDLLVRRQRPPELGLHFVPQTLHAVAERIDARLDAQDGLPENFEGLPPLRRHVLLNGIVAGGRVSRRLQMDGNREVRRVRRGRRQEALQLRVGAVQAGVGLVQVIPRLDLLVRNVSGLEEIFERQLLTQVIDFKPIPGDPEHEGERLALRLEPRLRNLLSLALQVSPFARRSLFREVHSAPPERRTLFQPDGAAGR